MRDRARAGWLLAALAAALMGCRDLPPREAPRTKPAAVTALSTDSIRSAVAAAIEQVVWNQSAPRFMPAARWALVRHIYDAGHYAPLWLTPDGLTPAARRLVDAACDDFGEGIRITAFAADTSPSWLTAGPELARSDARTLARIDLRLTAALIDYLADLGAGQVTPGAVSRHWAAPAPEPTPDSLLISALQLPLDQAAALFRPASGAYAPLRVALGRYRAMDARDGWTEPARTPLLRPGGRDSAVGWLRHRLLLSGDLGAADSTRRDYDAALVAAVRQAQRRYGLRPDGVVGAATWRALAAPAHLRAGTLAANLERLRWMPRAPDGTVLVLDLGAGTLDLHAAGELMLTVRVTPDGGCRADLPPVLADTIRAATPDSSALVLLLAGGRSVRLRGTRRGGDGCLAPDALARLAGIVPGMVASGSPVLLYVVAPTVTAGADGNLRFLGDTTGEDDRLRAALDAAAPVAGCARDDAAGAALTWLAPRPPAGPEPRPAPRRWPPAPAGRGSARPAG